MYMKYLNFDLFQDYFEISHKNMKFTSEAKSTNEFSFLYMTISNKSGKFETLVSHNHWQLCSNVIKNWLSFQYHFQMFCYLFEQEKLSSRGYFDQKLLFQNNCFPEIFDTTAKKFSNSLVLKPKYQLLSEKMWFLFCPILAKCH